MINTILRSTRSQLIGLSNYVSQKRKNRKELDEWFKIDGDLCHRLDYNLDNNSIVFDIGGYKGQWSANIFSKYCCNIHIFEPVNEFSSKIQNRFSKNNNVIVNNFGLSDKSEYCNILINNDSSSIFKSKNIGKIEKIQLVDIIEYIDEKQISNIDLMKINIEGGEYDLLEHLIETNYILKINNIQIQFHNFIPNATERMKKIQEKLTNTHHLTYQYLFIWENWERNI